MITIILLLLAGMFFGWMFLKPMSPKKFRATHLKPGSEYSNRKGRHWAVNDRGNLVHTESIFSNPKVREDMQAMHRMFMCETIIALWEGRRPPHSVGGYGTLTKKKLIIEWNDEWQEEMDKLSEYHDISYNLLFGIPEDHPPIGIILTAEEILAAYGSEEKES